MYSYCYVNVFLLLFMFRSGYSVSLLSCVLFVCKCHRLSTQLRLTNISHHIISYHIISYHIIQYHIIYHIIYHISYHISYHIISYHVMSCHIISIIYQSYHIISYHIISITAEMPYCRFYIT